jgi:glucose/arabinose dehydrogenase
MMYRVVLFLFLPFLFLSRLAFANTPPAAPVIVEPALELQALNGADVHMVTAPFVDVDGDAHRCSDWEIREGDAVVWSAPCAEGAQKLHIHLGDGVFSGSHAGLLELRADSRFTLRVRHRDSSGDPQTEWSSWTSRDFRTVIPTPVAPLRLDGVLTDPAPRWTSGDADVVLPAGASLDLETVDGDSMLHIDESGSYAKSQVAKVIVRLRLTFGSGEETLPPSELSLEDSRGEAHTLYLPAITPDSKGARFFFWVSANGSTHAAAELDRAPDFSRIARGAPVPWDVERGFRAEIFASGFELPVALVAVPHPGSEPDSPYLYVAELYGSVKVVTRSGEVRDFARGLLNFDPHDSIPGSGERGLGGITIDPANGDLIVSGIYKPDPAAPKISPRVLRLQSDDGGYTAARVIPLIEFPNDEAVPSHQISNVIFGPDDKLYVHVGSTYSFAAREINNIDGKILRMNRDGSAPPDNPFYNAGDGINATDYVYAYGFRNPFGGAWRIADGQFYEVENGPSVDRMAVVTAGRNYLWDDTDASMRNYALYNWETSVAPVQIAFTEPERFNGSGFPAAKQRSAFVTESGATWASGPQKFGKRISEFPLGLDGSLLAPPTALAEYNGSGKATAAGLAAGPDGLFFTDLYKDWGQTSPFDAGANVFRIRWTGFAESSARFLTPSTVALTDRSDVPDSGSVVWDFGDGTGSTERNPVHQYQQSGTYLIWQTVVGAHDIIRKAKPVFAGADSPELVAAYYDNEQSTIPRAIQIENALAFDWTEGAPPPTVPSHGFAAWFAVDVKPRFTETYRFTIHSRDRVRLLLDGKVLIDAWDPNDQEEHTASIELTAGHAYPLAVQYANASQSAPSLRVVWESDNQSQLVVPYSTGIPKRRAVGVP